VKPEQIRTSLEWDAFEGQRWLEAVAERGLHYKRLDRDEQNMVERAEDRNRAILKGGAT
jgi:hypothetical protein